MGAAPNTPGTGPCPRPLSIPPDLGGKPPKNPHARIRRDLLSVAAWAAPQACLQGSEAVLILYCGESNEGASYEQGR